MAYADISAMQHTFTDFAYNTKIAAQGNSRSAVLRDGKIFEKIEDTIEKTSENLARQCALNDANRNTLKNMLVELHIMKNAFQKTALGTPPADAKGIRSQNKKAFDAIIRAYHPNATKTCENTSDQSKDMAKSLKSLFQIGGKLEDSLSTWRKALALIRGGGNGMSVSEVQQTKRQLLANELARQGMTANMQQAILRNFDCYTAKMQNPDSVENALDARIQCLSNPIL